MRRQVDPIDVGPPGDAGRVNRLYAVLSNVNEVIVRAREPQQLYEAACRIAVEDGLFILAWIGFVDADSQYVRVVAKHGSDDGYLETVNISLSEDLPEGRGPTGTALREGHAFINNDTANNPAMRPWRDEQLRRGIKSSASFPLRVEGTTIGVLTLYAGEVDYFDDEEVRLLECLADDFSFALQSAQVARQREEALEALKESRRDLEKRVEERTAALEAILAERDSQATYAEALNRINDGVHSTLDFDEIMNLAVVEIADVLEVDAVVVQVRRAGYWEFAYAHGLPEGLRFARLADEDVPLTMKVLETRAPVVVNDVAQDATVNVRTMDRFAITALMAVPLIVRGEVFGILLADRFGPPAPFDAQQLGFLQNAASALALALENARLYQSEHRIAETLQQALLSLPDRLPGIDFAPFYRSATESTLVGGDFYDIFELDDRRIGLTIGDISGKGLDAAVLTSLVRNTIRAHANREGQGPAQILALTNDIVTRSTSAEAFATVFFGILDRTDGRLVYSNAGHTTGAILRGDSSISRLPTTGPLLGAFPGLEFGQCEVLLEVDELLFLYTDGLTEARRDAGQFGEARLFSLLPSMQGLSTLEASAAVVGDVMSFSGERLRDDLAILAVRRLHPSEQPTAGRPSAAATTTN